MFNSAENMRAQHWAILSATGIFILGTLIYPLRTIVGGLDGAFGGSFSAFSHALFFVLAWTYPFKSGQSLIIGSGLIGVIISSFELLQKPEVLSGLHGYLPSSVTNYAKYGVYDPLDITAGFLGIAIAGGIVLVLIGEKDT